MFKKFRKKKENTEVKEKNKLNWKQILLIVFSLYGLTFSVANGLIVEGVVSLENYKLATVFYKLFPFANPTDLPVESVMNPVTSTAIGVLMVSVINIMLPLAVLLLSYKFIVVLVYYTTDSESPEAVQKIISASVLLVVTFTLSPAALIEYDAGEDGNIKITPVQYAMYSFLGEKLLKLEVASEKDFTVAYMIPEIELGHPLAIKDDLRLFLEGYLSNDFIEEEKNINVFKVDESYKARFDLGNGSYIFNMPIDQTKNKKASAYFGVDLEAKELEMAKDYFQTLIDTAVIAKRFTEQVEVGTQGDTISNTTIVNYFNNEVYYDKDYREYCSTIETPATNRMNIATYNNYLEILTACKSEEFLAKHYNNKKYDYKTAYSETNPYLRTGFVMIFGQNEVMHRLTAEEIAIEVGKICKEGFFSCSEAVSFAIGRHETSKIKIGFLTRPARALNDLFKNTFKGYSIAAIETRTFTKDDIINEVSNLGEEIYGAMGAIDAGDGLSGTLAFSMNMPGIPNSYNTIINEAGSGYFDFVNVIPKDVDDVVKMSTGITIANTLQRFNTCLDNPEVVTDNFRCRSATLELLDISKSIWSTGLKIKMYNALSRPFSTKKEGGISQEKTKDPIVETIKSKLARYALIGGLFYQSSSDATFKGNPYSLGYTSEALVATSLISKSLQGSLPAIIDSTASKMMFFGMTLFTVVFMPIIFFVYRFLEKLFEIIIEIIIMPLTSVIYAYKQGEVGVMNIFKEFIVDIGILVVYAIVPYVILAFYDMKISFFIREILGQMDETFTSFQSIILNSALLLLYIFIFGWMLIASHSKMSEMIKEKLERDIKNM
jgi:hypothetical protein